jgi:hypothetical protein
MAEISLVHGYLFENHPAPAPKPEQRQKVEKNSGPLDDSEEEETPGGMAPFDTQYRLSLFDGKGGSKHIKNDMRF